jgi:hypothetical protein
MSLLDAALQYASQGWFVFPCKPGEKVPIGGRGHLDASIDPAQITAWWRATPQANIGVAVAPSNLVVLDVDTAEGKPGLASLREIDAHIPDTKTARTGRGGYHGVFVRPPDMPPQRRIGFKPGLDLLGDGYFVAAPSVLSNGTQYRWERSVPPAPLPQVLRDIAAAPRTQARVEATGGAIIEGNRNNSLFALGCALRDTGIGAEALSRALDAENRLRFKPPVDDFELGTIVNSVLNSVEVRRDVALGAVVQQTVRDIFAPAPTRRSALLSEVVRTPVPPMTFYSTGFPALDKLMSGGFATRHFCGLIAPPSTGKSALVGHWLLLLAKRRPVLHVSTELPRWELMIRYAAHEMKFAWVNGVKGVVKQDTMVSALEGLNIRVLGCDDLDRNDPLGCIEEEVKLMAAENNGVAPIVAIDYIQNMATGASTETRFKVGELAQRARVISQVYDTVVLGVFSTQRTGYQGKSAQAMRDADDPTAYLGAAKESGDIEFHCATLMYLDVDKLHAGDPKPGRIAVARCRVGDVGFVGVRARLAHGEFAEDEGALTEMSAEHRKERAEAQNIEDDCKKVLEAIKAYGGQAWGTIQGKTQLAGKRADAARDKLLENGLIRRDDDVRKNGTKIPRAFTFWVVENAASPTRVPPEDEP